ncbi:MAG: PEP-CTERM sorting domain-containing protein [Phycisphaerales bacterium]|nr:PEP-CTERM sorting domain-containing protein [Phycisphaerales bacterium]
MSRTTAAVLVVLTTVTSFASAATIDLAYSSFDANHDGWQSRDTLNGTTSYFSVDWNATGGMPTGHIEFADITQGGYVFEAPTQFTGDFSMATGVGGVSFDWMADMIQDGKRASVIFHSSNGVRLWASSNPDPAAGIWHSFSFNFDANAGWKVDFAQGAGAQTATVNDISQVLGNVIGMDITGETWTGVSETTWLDNPRIWMRDADAPAPGALALLGLAGIAGSRRRRRN